MIENKEFIIKRSEIKSIIEIPDILETEFGINILRWYISKTTENEIFVEITLLKNETERFFKSPINTIFPGKSVVLNVIPTGIGCEIGGYAGDASPVTALLGSCVDCLITNPNAINASNFIFMGENVFYTEGFIIDLFCKGLVNLYKPYLNNVGLIIDKPDKGELEVVFNIINTVRAVYGIEIENYVITDESIGGFCIQNKSGSYVGGIKNINTLYTACAYLIEKGVNAIAVTSNIKDLPLENYADHFEGKHPNPIGGAEAIISHSICRKFKIPAAHAPLLNIKDLKLKNRIVDARGAGEFSSTSGLACILIGLSKAPQIMEKKSHPIKDIVNINNLMAVVAPASALGGVPMFYAQRNNIPIIAVRDNKTILDITHSKLDLKNVFEVNNYLEAAGVIKALKEGICISSLYRPLLTVRFSGEKNES